MAQVACSRCFALFDSGEACAGAAPLCPRCVRAPAVTPPPATRTGPATPPPRTPAPLRASARRSAPVLPLVAGAAAVLLLAGGAVAAVRLVPRLRAPRAPRAPAAEAPPPPTPVEERVAAWREAGLVPRAAPAREAAGGLVARGRADLAADAPPRTRDAIAAFREALAVDPRRLDAVAGYAEAVAELADGDPDADAEDLRVAHALVAHARGVGGDRADVLAAYARLLLAVPSAANDREALAVAERAQQLAPEDPSALLALGLARSRADAAAGARVLEDGARAGGDLRLVSAAARVRWGAGDAGAALALVERRLASDPGAGGALMLRAEIEAASDRLDAARATLARWQAADSRSPLPPLLAARLAYQREGDLAAARRLLDDALSREPRDFVAARALAHRAAVARASGDRAAAANDVAEALRRVPGSAPARFQEALLAFGAGDAAALRRAAGVVGDRAGPVAAKLLAARSAELSGTVDEAVAAYRALADTAPRDPAVLLGAAGALARLRAPGPALEVARRALARDFHEARVRRPPTEFWEGPAPLAEAAQGLEGVARAEPQGAATAYAAAAQAELVLGHAAEAERLARAATAASPQAGAPLALLAEASLATGRPAAATLLPARAATANGGAPARATLARVAEALGRAADAERLWGEAVDLAPDMVTARLALAGHLLRRGERDAARALLEGLLAEDPGIASARGALLALSAAAPPAPDAPAPAPKTRVRRLAKHGAGR